LALYRYIALNAEGKKTSGVIDSDSLEGAKTKLRKQKAIVTKITLAVDANQVTLNTSLLINFTRELAQLLQSGLPLYESLVTIEEKYQGHKSHVLFLDLCDRVKEGKTLSQSLSMYPKTFDAIYISMVEAGERTGSLETTFFQLYKVISRSDKFKRQVRSAMVYPAFLGCFCLIILLGLFLFLIPAMQEILEGRALHPITKTVLAISNCLNSHIGGFVAIGLGVGIIIYCIQKWSRAREGFKKLLLKIPTTRNLITEAIMMRFCRALSVLLSSGIPIVEALRLSRNVMQNQTFEEMIKQSEQGLICGKKLSAMFKQSALIPPLVTRMLATAEETGATAPMLLNISEIYEEMLEKNLSQFTNLLQPVMLLVLGIMVGLILLSVLLPLTDVSTLI